ncbi:variant erythrocyte surface antigen-1 family protein [Babesia caballi]|uniref:Variant erythrocyte surface antigen-1 family protein n=1 Tax=Babesia caballi TaxID=5871 RepID=A0AAV4LN83_BABCB|nr:variant erythrocyte surface antigen-1 family protein [Babesia caballi]
MGNGKKNSLTDWPDNLKDVIDWVLRINELDKSGDLKNAVEALEPNILQNTGLSEGSMQGLFNKVANGLKEFIGYGGDWNVTGNGIGLEYSAGGYSSSYKNATRWEGNTASDHRSRTCATILLYSFPLLYFGLTYLFWRCSGNNGWQEQTTSGDRKGIAINSFLSEMGYNSGLRTEVDGRKIAKLLGGENDSIQDFKTLYSSVTYDYPQFLEQLKQKGITTPKPIDVPLYKLYSASHAYLQYKVGPSAIMELPQTKSDIAKTLKGYSEAVKKLDSGNAQKLSEAYLTLLEQIKSVFDEDPPASSSVGAAAGGVLGTAALGTAAALATNVGGITTTLKSLIPIFK